MKFKDLKVGELFEEGTAKYIRIPDVTSSYGGDFVVANAIQVNAKIHVIDAEMKLLLPLAYFSNEDEI